MSPVVRRATVDDIDDLLRLRAVMVAAIDGEVEAPGTWSDQARVDLAERLPEVDGDLAGFVVDGPSGRPVSGGLGIIQKTVASAHRPDGRSGYVFNVATDPEHRGNGYATAVMEAMLAWFIEHGVELVDLRASRAAESLYERLGFTAYDERAYSIRLTPKGRAARSTTPPR